MCIRDSSYLLLLQLRPSCRAFSSVAPRPVARYSVLMDAPGLSRSVTIQVKTRRTKGTSWLLNVKAESFAARNLFYVFVCLGAEKERAVFHVVPSKVVAEYVTKSHRHWLAKPSKAGKPHKDSEGGTKCRNSDEPYGVFSACRPDGRSPREAGTPFPRRSAWRRAPEH